MNINAYILWFLALVSMMMAAGYVFNPWTGVFEKPPVERRLPERR